MKLVELSIVRTLHVQLSDDEVFPDALFAVCVNEGIKCARIRGGGVVRDTQLRITRVDGSEERVRVEGLAELVTLDGMIEEGASGRQFSGRGLLARSSVFGTESIAGAVERTRAVAAEFTLEVTNGSREIALRAPAGATLTATPSAPPPKKAPVATGAWGEAASASESLGPALARTGYDERPAIPGRPRAPSRDVENETFPIAGDIVEHFAFGRCEVLKSDGDRLHLKVQKDGRIREIALEKLEVSVLDSNGPHRRFKLERKL